MARLIDASVERLTSRLLPTDLRWTRARVVREAQRRAAEGTSPRAAVIAATAECVLGGDAPVGIEKVSRDLPGFVAAFRKLETPMQAALVLSLRGGSAAGAAKRLGTTRREYELLVREGLAALARLVKLSHAESRGDAEGPRAATNDSATPVPRHLPAAER